MSYTTLIVDKYENHTYLKKSMIDGINLSKKLVLRHGHEIDLYRLDIKSGIVTDLGTTKINPHIYEIKSRNYKRVISARFIRRY